ncbi:MAG: FAD-dependent oxidoreductase [Gammaproteobacteria bacterium]|nr:FAD-dependent oxidoreductase [Gammaproteobacteria bacterium]
MSQPDVLIVGAGIYGLSAALALAARGNRVHVIDPGPIPHPLSSSSDINKAIRMEYGDDAFYLEQAARARDEWLRWNEEFDEQLYNECGLLVLAKKPMQPGSYEHDSYEQLKAHGFEPQHVDAVSLRQNFPAWCNEQYQDAFFHDKAGFADSGRVISALARRAITDGVILQIGSRVDSLVGTGNRVTGVITEHGEQIDAGAVVVAAGAWAPLLVPQLQPFIHSVGQPVFYVRPCDQELFLPPAFPVFTADVANTGWYGFPLHPRESVVKIANHGVGKLTHPVEGRRKVGDRQRADFASFLETSLPALAKGELVSARLCLYCDTRDGHFWIDRDPSRDGLVVATGGSGHAFKIGPLLGDWSADVVEHKNNDALQRFRWRELGTATSGEEAARCWTHPAQAG